MSEPETLFGVLRHSADAKCVGAIEHAVREAPDRDLCRINVLSFAAKHGLDEERTIAAFLHAARLVFKHPEDGRRMEFLSALPDDLQRVLDELRERNPHEE